MVTYALITFYLGLLKCGLHGAVLKDHLEAAIGPECSGMGSF